MKVSKFASYLVDKGYTSIDNVLKAMDIQRKRKNIPIGELAMQHELLTTQQTYDILTAQSTNKSKRFGEIAIELGYLTKAEVLQLNKMQLQLRSSLTKMLLEMGSISQGDLNSALQAFCTEKTGRFFCKSCGEVFDEPNSLPEGKRCSKCGGSLVPPKAKDTAPKSEAKSTKKDSYSGSPLFIQTHACPVCGSDNEHAATKLSHYYYRDRDVDMKPIDCQWHNRKHARFYPPIYDIWQCSSCYFTAMKRYFENPIMDTSMHLSDFSNAVNNIMEEDIRLKSVIKALKEDVLPLKINVFIAIKRYLTAIFILENIDKIKNRDSITLGRYYLHLAWIFRDLEQTDSKAVKKIKAKVMAELGESLAIYWSYFPKSDKESLEKALHYYDQAFYSSSLVEKRQIEHYILQITGRINLKLGNRLKAKQDLFEGIRIAERLFAVQNQTLISAKKDKNALRKIKPQINKTKKFITETRNVVSRYFD